LVKRPASPNRAVLEVVKEAAEYYNPVLMRKIPPSHAEDAAIAGVCS